MSDEPTDQSNLPLVVVFGAGVTGLAAAHELIERGFRVHVLESAESLDSYGCCEVGGMARSQYAHIPKQWGAKDGQRLQAAPPVFGTPQLLYFANGTWNPDGTLGKEHVANKWVEPPNQAKLGELVRTLQRMRAHHSACGFGKITLRIIGHTCDSEAAGRSRVIGEERARAVAAELWNAGLSPNDFTFEIHSRGASRPNGDNSHATGRARNNRVSFEVEEVRLPAEHGYRFYPAFYHHLDDQLRRIPVYDDAGKPTFRSVLDNLQQAESANFAIEDSRAPLGFERRLPRSFEELRRTAEDFAERLQFPPEDVLLFELKMFTFLTSCIARRKQQYEKMSWWDFVEGPRFDPKTQRHILAAPQALVAMEATVTDAYTAGNIYVQLMLDHLTTGARVDRTMNAPTSEAWLRHWKRYLRLQGVKFFLGTLTSLTHHKDGTIEPVAQRILAGQVLEEKPLPEPVYWDETENFAGRDKDLTWTISPKCHYVVALPAIAARDLFAKAPLQVAELGETLRKLRTYDVGDQDEATGRRQGPLRDFVGIQFYFDHDFKFTRGHTYYPDSDWGLSSISQLQFWRDRRTRDSRYLGVLSVDIGNMVELDRSDFRECVVQARAATRKAEAAFDAIQADLAKDERAAVGRAIEGARAVRDAAIALIPSLPLRLSKDYRQAVLGMRQPNLRQAIANTRPLARTDDDRRVDALISEIAKHHDTVEQDRGLSPAKRSMDLVARTFASVIDALQFINGGEPAWLSSPDEIAKTVWRQIKLGLDVDQAATIPEPLWYHIDDSVTFANDRTRIIENRSPFQINPADEFERRPCKGTDMPTQITDPDAPTQDDSPPTFYEVSNKQWVLAGMYTKSYTRLTTMEMGVETARHATNAILNDLRATGRNMGDFCKIENPEDHEVDDLAFLKRIDAQLVAEGLPHFVDILGMHDAVLLMKQLRERGRFDENPLDRALQLLRAGFRTGRSELSTLEALFPMPLMPSLSVRDGLSDLVDKAANLLQTAIKQLPDLGGGGR